MPDNGGIETITSVLQLLNTFGVTAVLYIFLRMFIRGDILSRPVWEEMTKAMVVEMSTRIMSGVEEMIEEWRREAKQEQEQAHV